MYKCINFDKELWFELGKCIWRKHHSVFRDQLKYICNDIVNPFCVEIFHYAEHVQDIHDLPKHLSSPLMKGKSFETDSWKVRKTNSPYMRLEFLLRTYSPLPCRMIWRIIKGGIVALLMKIGVTSCPQSRSNIIGKGKLPESMRLQLWERPLILTAANPLEFHVRRRLGLVSSTISKGGSTPRITVHSATACFSRRQECLIKIICCIALKNFLARVMAISSSGMDW